MLLFIAMIACATRQPVLAAFVLIWMILGSGTRLHRLWLWVAFMFAVVGMPLAALWGLVCAWIFESPKPLTPVPGQA